MRTGEILEEFSVKGIGRVVLRTPKWEDLDGLLGLFNSVVVEGVDIARDEKISREEEIDWLSRLLSQIERGKTFFLVAEVDGKVVASSDINRQIGFQKHVGVVGIIIDNDFRDLGIGTAMMRALTVKAKKMGFKVLTLSAFATNKRAMHVYQKVGFKQTGMIPKKFLRKGKYIDEVIMTKLLK